MNRETDAPAPEPGLDIKEQMLEQKLKALRPAQDQLDPRQVFYQAGYQAGRASTPRWRNQPLSLAAAVLLTAIITGPLSYQAGTRNEAVVQQPLSTQHVQREQTSHGPQTLEQKTTPDPIPQRETTEQIDSEPQQGVLLAESSPGNKSQTDIPVSDIYSADSRTLNRQLARLLAMDGLVSNTPLHMPDRGTLTAMHSRTAAAMVMSRADGLPVSLQSWTLPAADSSTRGPQSVRDLTEQRLRELVSNPEVIR